MTQTARRRRTLQRSWRLLVGVTLVAVVIWRLGPRQLFTALTTVSPVVLLPAMMVGCLPPVFHAWRWRRLLEISEERVSILDAVRVTVAASVANYALPAFGWAPAKVVATKRWLGIQATSSVPTVLIEHALDSAVLLFLGFTGLVALGVPVRVLTVNLPNDTQGWFVVFGATAFGLAVAALAGLRWGSRLVVTSVRQGYRVVRTLWRDPVVWIATVGRWGAEFVLLAILTWATGLHLPVAALLVLLGLPGILGLLAPVPGGLGIREATGVVLATALGLGAVGVVAVLTWQRLAALAGLAIVGVASSFVRRYVL
ncbi:flippase-like domain-containing protein [Thermomicrobium sp. CFH 73360]|uniref:lysylphosphatidylglycerol synthase transmembrane domain-containing protein n=1 Tax=Thermomicrobium sp. CFH 73360 TaxID=2951987 RepID=UPI002076B249|nr:lysylphosphatidylglycerol synthase transmembrane domain-containing protein [Thermomicrobium sp. CFH 73360]MCM8745175.1 flippase-like domain-containing protein [Thermomicrobium sp. CFH 73360]